MDQAHQILKDIFGFPKFRLSQEAVISRLLVDNENALVVFPTGGGKSLVYQIPALCLDGLTLVISPLIALMKDQVDALVKRGVNAANLDSTLTVEQSRLVKEEVLAGRMKILYVAPERLNNEGFVELMSRVKISLLAVDEAHCISQWGSSFRPEYLKIARFAQEQNVERVLCLTATATPNTLGDICKSFSIAQDGVFRIPVYRPNLSLQVQATDSLAEKIRLLIPILKSRTGPSIVYVTLQKQAESVASQLLPHGIDAMVYHAGLPNDKREQVQTAFMASPNGVVVCTIAFGMGIDKSNIRQIIHLFMPKTLENYSQEVGRAGRDGLPSLCTMFLSAEDIPTLEGFCRGDTCARQDLELWLQEVVMKTPGPDGTLDFNHYKQGRDYDIRANVLGLCYAQLELDYGFIRAITPFYSTYELTPVKAGWNSVIADNTAEAKAIKSHWHKKGASKYELDITDAAESPGLDRNALLRKINDWEFGGKVLVKASQVRARYAVLKPFVKTTEAIKALAEKLYKDMLVREEDAIRRLREVIQFATNNECLAYNLSKYFGDEAVVPDGLCKTCTFCLKGQSPGFEPQVAGEPDLGQLQAILQACPARDDPRLLARFAFGITSPRLTANKWSSGHPLFGSMAIADFDRLVAAFDKECAKVDYESVLISSSVPSTKRKNSSFSNSNATAAYNNDRGRPGRGAGVKRARH